MLCYLWCMVPVVVLLPTIKYCGTVFAKFVFLTIFNKGRKNVKAKKKHVERERWLIFRRRLLCTCIYVGTSVCVCRVLSLWQWWRWLLIMWIHLCTLKHRGYIGLCINCYLLHVNVHCERDYALVEKSTWLCLNGRPKTNLESCQFVDKSEAALLEDCLNEMSLQCLK